MKKFLKQIIIAVFALFMIVNLCSCKKDKGNSVTPDNPKGEVVDDGDNNDDDNSDDGNNDDGNNDEENKEEGNYVEYDGKRYELKKSDFQMGNSVYYINLDGGEAIVTQNGKLSGNGQRIAFAISTPSADSFNEDIATGTYIITTDKTVKRIALCTFYSNYDFSNKKSVGEKNSSCKEGEITVSLNGEEYTISFTVCYTDGKIAKGFYKGPIECSGVML